MTVRGARLVLLVVALVAGSLLGGLPVAVSAPSAVAAPSPCATAMRAGLYLLPGGASRNVWVYVPRALTAPGTRKPVVVLLHGSGQNGAEFMDLVRMRAAADKDRFVIVAPNGGTVAPRDSDAGSDYLWTVPGAPDGLTSGSDLDVAFLSRLVPLLPQRLCVDPTRTYMAGFSGGGRLTSAFGCRHRDLVAAIAPVAALRAGPAEPGEDGALVPGPCPDTGPGRPPLPIVSFHGVDDAPNPYGGDPPGQQTRRWGYSVPTALARWAEINGCDPEPTRSTVPASPRTSKLTHAGCAGGTATVELYRTEGPGVNAAHDWPLSAGFNANDIIWQRFVTARR